MKCGPLHRITDTRDHNTNPTSINIPQKSPWCPKDGTSHTPNESGKAEAIPCSPSLPKENPGHCKDLVQYNKSPAPPPKPKIPPYSSYCSVAQNQKILNNESCHSRGIKTACTIPQITPHSICTVAQNQKRQNDKSGLSNWTTTVRTLSQNHSTTMTTPNCWREVE